MKFPELKIVEEIDNPKKTGDYLKLLKCELSWQNLENEKIRNHKNWILNHRTSGFNDLEIESLKSLLEDLDWDSFNYPENWKQYYDKFSTILIPKPYYDEIKHFEKLALEEWNRSRPFDTSVRESCLKVAEESVNLYFYLLYDAVYIYNKDLYNEYFDLIIIRTLWSFRFWKHQTGGGLVLKKSTSHCKNLSVLDLERLKGILISDLSINMRHDVMGMLICLKIFYWRELEITN